MDVIEDLCLPQWLVGLLNDFGEWVELALQAASALMVWFLDWLRLAFEWDIHLEDHWHYIFTMVCVYTFKDAQNALAATWLGHKVTAFVRFAAGFTFALVAGFVGGLASGNNPIGNALIAGSLVAAIFGYRLVWAARFVLERRGENIRDDAGHDLLKDLRDKLSIALIMLGIGLIFVALSANASSLPALGSLTSPGLAALIALIGALALFHFILAARNARPDPKIPDDTWLKAFLRQGNFKLGRMIAPSLLGPFIVAVFNHCP